MSTSLAAHPNVREWLTLAETKERLGKSAATIGRLVQSGELHSNLEPRQGRKPERLYHAGDVERLKRESEERPLTQALAPRPTALLLSPDFAAAASAIAERFLAPKTVPVTEKLWLSLDEAVEYSGLAKSDLREICRGAFKAASLGRLVVRKSGGWKILRKSLESFEG